MMYWVVNPGRCYRFSAVLLGYVLRLHKQHNERTTATTISCPRSLWMSTLNFQVHWWYRTTRIKLAISDLALRTCELIWSSNKACMISDTHWFIHTYWMCRSPGLNKTARAHASPCWFDLMHVHYCISHVPKRSGFVRSLERRTRLSISPPRASLSS